MSPWISSSLSLSLHRGSSLGDDDGDHNDAMVLAWNEAGEGDGFVFLS